MPAPVIRRAYESIHDAVDASLNTALISLSPAFLAALRGLDPKKRRMKFRHVVALAMLAVVAVLGADRSTRAFATEKGHALVGQGKLVAARWHHAPPQGPSLTSAQTPVTPAASAPVVAPAAKAAADDKASAPAGQRFDELELVVPAPSASSKNSRAVPPKGKGVGVRGPRSALRSPSRHGLVAASISSSL
jgi:hypothetical protein